MGTNYYIAADHCDKCGRFDEQLHIGKSSAGWAFSLHVGTGKGEGVPLDLAGWLDLFDKNKIVDECGREISKAEMVEIITKREVVHRRHEVDFKHCIGNGDSTYDLMIGEFC